ncbi:hypothetical protein CLOSTMETH_01858 [[Clostridium] methylpentosum DSM 5476]|uniref:Uncharacterized protein n=1 Tax=[Clostridium] methylpentosum DSM 5476 TaxID=537013 RepID=C0EDD1_9FIRM|nr:hypothetical protein CLOSTMETH_01858 [[Clostridium] methylpentosum DSM 5476]
MRGATSFAHPFPELPVDISIHAPLVGSDLSAKAAHPGRIYFNPRSPCGERPLCPPIKKPLEGISIHAPLVGSDADNIFHHISSILFQSTLPLWGAT